MQAAVRPRGTAWAEWQPSVVDPDDLARQHVANDVRADEVEGARLRGDDPVVSDLAERERPDPERVTERDERPVGDRDDRVRPFEPAHGGGDGLGERGRIAAEQAGDHLGVGGRGEPDAGRDELVPQRPGSTRFPLWASATVRAAPWCTSGCAFDQRAPPVVE